MIISHKNYFNTASYGLIDSEVISYAYALDLKIQEDPVNVRNEFWEINLSNCRRYITTILNVDSNCVALVPNFTWAFNALVDSLEKGKVLLNQKDYPTVQIPFINHNFETVKSDFVKNGEFSLAHLEDFLKKNAVKYYALSHVDYMSGFRYPISEIATVCKQYNVDVLIDGTQAFGAFLDDLSNVSFYSASTYKWLQSGLGNGFVYLSTSFREKQNLKIGGFGNSEFKANGDFEIQASIMQFEPGHVDINAFARMEKALEIYARDYSKREQQIKERMTRFLDVNTLNPNSVSNPEHWSGIISVPETQLLQNVIKEQSLQVTQRNGLVRFSFHTYTPIEEIIKFI